MIWGRPLLRPALAACSVWVCTCAGVCMWALAVMCTCIQMHACRIVCKITSMCAHVYMGACRCVRACAFPTAVVSSAKGGAEPAIHSLATPVVSATWLGFTCVSLCTLV